MNNDNVKKCLQCGKEINKSAKFCPYCGKLQEMDKETPFLGKQNQNEEQPVQPEESVQAEQSIQLEEPVQAEKTVQPEETVPLEQPVQLEEAMQLDQPEEPDQLTQPIQPIQSAQPIPPVQPTQTVQQKKKKIPIVPIIIAGAAGFFAIIVATIFILLFVCFHDWTPATCMSPEICTKCGKTRGEVADHDWIEATCESPMKCNTCGETEGFALEHEVGNWVVEKEASFSSDGIKVKKCSLCNKVIDSENFSLTSHHSNGKFIFTPSEFADRLDDEIDDYDRYLSAEKYDEGDDAGCVVYDGSKPAAVVTFAMSNSSDNLIERSEENTAKPGVVLCGLNSSADADTAANTMLAVVMTCDPSVSREEARDLCISLIDKYQVGLSVASMSKNGLTYKLTEYEDLIIFKVEVDATYNVL